MKYEISKIDILSVVKIIFIVSLFIGAAIGIFQAFILSFFRALIAEIGASDIEIGVQSIGVLKPFFMIISTTLFVAFFNSFIAAVVVLVYNLLAQWLGGIKVDLDSTDK